MHEITAAIEARQTQIAQLLSKIDALRRAASVLGGETTAKATRHPKTKSEPKRKRRPMSAAAKKAMSKRMKAYWAKRKRARR